jgi:hypothetical protein
MRRDQLEHAIRTACQIIGRREVIVVGSQSILGTFREEQLPADATMSVEIDILPIADDNAETERLASGPDRRCRRRVLPIRGTPRLQHRRRRPQHVSPADRVARQARQGPERQHRRTRRCAAVHRLVPRQRRPVRRQALRFPGKGPELRRGTRALRPRRPPDHPRPTAHRGRALRPRGQPGRLLAPVFRPLSREPETNLAKSLAAAGKLDQASAVAIEAEVVARSIAAYYVQKHILVDVAEALACAQMPEQAIAVARSIGERAVSRVAPVLAAAGTHEQAIMVARSITDATWRAEAFTSKKLFGSPFGSW